MNKTVELVNEWARFVESHPESGIGEFCRHYLLCEKHRCNVTMNFGGILPPFFNAFLAKLIGRLGKSLEAYTRKAVQEIPDLKQPEDFYFLNSITHLGESKKTDIIQYNFTEPATGVDVFKRLLVAGFTEERTDPGDKRAKLVKVTEKGRRVLDQCYEKLTMMSDFFFHELGEDDVRLCIQLLRGLEATHSKMVVDTRDMTIADIYRKTTGKVPVTLAERVASKE